MCGGVPSDSSVPYEKGFALLNELQRRVGVEPFRAFAKDYIKEFRCSNVVGVFNGMRRG